MIEPIRDLEQAIAHALTLPGTERSTSYGQPAVKIAANGQLFLAKGHEPASSFCLRLENGLVDILIETAPETFWQSPHYVGHPALLVRFASPEQDRVREAIARAHEIAAARKPVRPRKR